MAGIDFEKLFMAIPSPYMVLDAGLNFVSVNREYENATMRPAQAYVGRNVFEMFPNEGESGRRLRESFERVLRTAENDSLTYLPYDIPRPAERGGGFERRFWSCSHTPITDESGAVRFIVQNTVDVTDVVQLTEAASLPFRSWRGQTALIEHAQQVDRSREELIAESDEFRRLFQLAPGFFAILSGAGHVFTFANDAYVRLVGGRSVIGKSVIEALPEIQGQGFVEMLDHVYRTGEPRGGEATRVMLQQAEGEAPHETFLDFSYDAIRDAGGQVTGVFVQGMDRTETVRAMRRQKLLLDELNHRVKNTLAAVQSIASQTMRSSRSMEEARTAFEARIGALSKAHNLLSERQWSSTELAEIVGQELAAFGDMRARLSGPRVVFNSKASIAMAMVMHELSTNAAKYGALSQPDGSVSVTWRIDGAGPQEGLVIDWVERGGPAVEPPSRSGFGSRMIDRAVTGELGGECRFSYDRDGFRCRMTIAPEAYERTASAFA